MDWKKWLLTGLKGGLVGLLLWALVLFITFLFVILDGGIFAGIILMPLIIPLTPVIFVLIGFFFCHNRKTRKFLLVIYVILVIFWISILSYGYIEDRFTGQRTLYFNIDSDIQNNLEGCYEQFARRMPGTYGYLKCDYGVTSTMPDTSANRRKGIVGQTTGYDCSCEHSARIY